MVQEPLQRACPRGSYDARAEQTHPGTPTRVRVSPERVSPHLLLYRVTVWLTQSQSAWPAFPRAARGRQGVCGAPGHPAVGEEADICKRPGGLTRLGGGPHKLALPLGQAQAGCCRT